MTFLRNLLAIVGIATILLFAAVSPAIFEVKSRMDQFDPKAMDTYIDMFQKILETGNAAEATVWKAQVEEGLSFDEVNETILFVANEHNIKNVGELPLYKQVESMSGKPYRHAKIYMFCNAMTAARMLDYSDAYGAYLPCRVSLIEDKQGRMWLYTLNMDPMIHGGLPLPDALKTEALEVKAIMLDVLKRGASGEF
ncbi:MAG: DUF302 domain-containing protein [Rhodospirillaceae bacterium]|jgi:uncharacterized protein (DUF302 family)|nr:DUF302 domain-containing protein [Rhodospirillaceae bacterium]MBT4219453.1 DUF302 domain-containing protein [Rhodospirillaceae bacterium]MBT4463268.1 DUF302 domain-containing protein [Rhodospirillaceae bacterium]MBT5014312.1 DUF302 domain-containing protein [Rhodospirillaceae bacterium]MBT5308810.1 DUF302 domain-containing protein [Rhodospirillaceae bacterium]